MLKLSRKCLFGLFMVFFTLSTYATSYECVTGPVSSIAVGYVVTNRNKDDIRVTINGHSYYVTQGSNLEHPAGRPMLSLLIYSKTTGLRVGLYSHEGPCTFTKDHPQFDEVFLQDS